MNSYKKKVSNPEQRSAQDAYSYSLRLLAYRARSFRELTRKLTEKEYPEEVIDETTQRLIELDLIDDLRFGRELASTRIRNKHWGKARIRAELRNKGLDSDTIDDVISGIDPEEEATAVSKALAKWLRISATSAKDPSKLRERAARHLAQRGFNSALAIDALKRQIK